MRTLQLEAYRPEHSDTLPSVNVSLISLDVHESKAEQYEETEESMFEYSYRESLLDELNYKLQKKYPKLRLCATLEGRSGKHLCLNSCFGFAPDKAANLITGYKIETDNPGIRRAAGYAIQFFQAEASRLYDEYCTYWSSPDTDTTA